MSRQQQQQQQRGEAGQRCVGKDTLYKAQTRVACTPAPHHAAQERGQRDGLWAVGGGQGASGAGVPDRGEPNDASGGSCRR
jgi:hypothetical protein